MKKRLAGILLSCILAVSLTACGGGSDNSATAADSTTASATTEVGGKVVRVAAVDPQVALDPQQFTYSIVMKITDNVTESLLTTTADGLVPTLLTDMPSISDDNMTYSFELLPDVKFHDGTTLKASDVKYSYERLIKMAKMATLLENVVGYDEMSNGEAEELSGVQVQDDTHFTITLKKPYSPFLSVLSTAYCAIYPQEACEAAGDSWGMTTLVGTGPFKMDSYQNGVGVTLSRFDDYHGGAVKLDGVSYKFIEDVNTQVLEYQKGNVDYVDVDPSIYPVYSSNPELKDQMHGFQPTGNYSLLMNCKTYPDAKVREAIALSIDRAAICDSILHGTATVPTSYIPAGIIGHDDTLPEFEYNPEKAKQLLAEAGYADGVSVTCRATSTTAELTMIQEQLRAGGIEMNIEMAEMPVHFQALGTGDYDMYVSSQQCAYYSEAVRTTDGLDYSFADVLGGCGYQDEEYSELCQKALTTYDETERKAAYAEVQKYFREHHVSVTTYTNVGLTVARPDLQGFALYGVGVQDMSNLYSTGN